MEFNLADLFELVADTVPDRPMAIAGDVRRSYADTSKAAERLGWRAEVALEDVAQITNKYVNEGTEEAQRFLEEVRKRLHDSLMLRDGEAPVEFIDNLLDDASSIKVTTDAAGMKVTGDTDT